MPASSVNILPSTFMQLNKSSSVLLFIYLKGRKKEQRILRIPAQSPNAHGSHGFARQKLGVRTPSGSHVGVSGTKVFKPFSAGTHHTRKLESKADLGLKPSHSSRGYE